MRRVIRPSLLAVCLALLSAHVAFAAKPIHEKFVVDETYQEELCGIAVTTHDQTVINVLIFEDRLVDLSPVRITFTNDQGDWLELTIAGPVVITEEWNGDVLTQTAQNMGLHHKLRSAQGIDRATFDRGQITFETVIDFSDPEEPVLVSRDILWEAGPHPLAHSTTDAFCEAVISALG